MKYIEKLVTQYDSWIDYDSWKYQKIQYDRMQEEMYQYMKYRDLFFFMKKSIRKS